MDHAPYPPRSSKNAFIALMGIVLILLLSPAAFADHRASAPASPELAKRVKTRMIDAFGPKCETEYEPNRTEVFSPFYKGAPRLVRTWCVLGVYQLHSLHFLWWPDGRLEVLPFAVPVYRHRLEKKGSAQHTVIEEIEGFRTVFDLVGAKYDPRTHTIQSFYLQRGVGDAITMGRWRWRGDDGFVLEHFEADHSFDGVLTPTVVYSLENPDKSAAKKK